MRPEVQRFIGNRLKAMRNSAKLLLTPQLDFTAIERQPDHVLLKSPDVARDNGESDGIMIPRLVGARHASASA